MNGMPTQVSKSDSRSTIAGALGAVVGRSYDLLIDRFDLLQVEIHQIGQRATSKVIALVSGMLLALSGFGVLTLALLTYVSNHIGQLWSCCTIGGLYMLLGVALVAYTQRQTLADISTEFIPKGPHGNQRDTN